MSARESKPSRQPPSLRLPSSPPSRPTELPRGSQMEEVYEALRIVRTLALVALGSDNEEDLSTDVLAILQQRTLNRILVVTEKALAKAP
jgi:hypothetical protein